MRVAASLRSFLCLRKYSKISFSLKSFLFASSSLAFCSTSWLSFSMYFFVFSSRSPLLSSFTASLGLVVADRAFLPSCYF